MLGLAMLVAALSVAACGGSAGPDSGATATLGTGAAAMSPSSTAPVPTTAVGTSPSTTTPASTAPTTTGPGAAPLPTTAAELAAQLSAVETALGSPGLDQAGAGAWGQRQQLLYRILSADPAWADEVVAGADPAVREVVALNWEARTQLSSLVHSERLATSLPAWEIRPPAPADELLGYYHEAADATGVPWEVLAAINLVESRMGRIVGLSTAGAVGPMQFLPSTWDGCCDGDPTNDHDAIMGAAHYLVQRGAATDLDRAIRGYNNSDHYVRAVRAYASVLELGPDRYYGYHAWEVVFLSSAGLLRIPEGYHQDEPVDAAAWLAQHPDALVAGAI